MNKTDMNFIREHLPVITTWPADALEGWADWALERGFYFRATVNNTIMGLGIARPVASFSDVHNRYMFNADGEILCIDMAIGVCDGALRTLARLFTERFGTKQKIMYMRLRETGHKRLKIWDYHALKSKLLKGP